MGNQPHYDTVERWECGSQSNGTNEEYCLEGVLEHCVHLGLECLWLKDQHILEIDDLVDVQLVLHLVSKLLFEGCSS